MPACTLPDPWRSLADKLGGVGPLADALLCSERTLHRWAHGTTSPSPRDWAQIRRVFASYKIPPP